MLNILAKYKLMFEQKKKNPLKQVVNPQLASSQPLPILHRSSWLPQSNPYKPFIGFDLEFLLLWMKIQRPALSL